MVQDHSIFSGRYTTKMLLHQKNPANTHKKTRTSENGIRTNSPNTLRSKPRPPVPCKGRLLLTDEIWMANAMLDIWRAVGGNVVRFVGFPFVESVGDCRLEGDGYCVVSFLKGEGKNGQRCYCQ